MNRAVEMTAMMAWTKWQSDVAIAEGEEPEAVCRKAFELAFDTSVAWTLTCDEERFQVGCAVILLHFKGADAEVAERVRLTLDSLRALGAATRGVPVDFSGLADRMGEVKPLPLLALYREVKAEVTP